MLSILMTSLSIISYSAESLTVVDYSPGIMTDVRYWISKSPGRLSPATNLIRVFDYQSWSLIGVSIISVSVALFVFQKIGQSYGVMSGLDNFLIVMFPFSTLIGENLSEGFRRNKMKKEKKNEKINSFFPPGFAGNGLLLVWNAMAVIITMAFLCNIRAILLKPMYEAPIDTTEDIFKQGKIPIILFEGSYWRNYFLTSNNTWEKRTGKTFI